MHTNIFTSWLLYVWNYLQVSDSLSPFFQPHHQAGLKQIGTTFLRWVLLKVASSEKGVDYVLTLQGLNLRLCKAPWYNVNY